MKKTLLIFCTLLYSITTYTQPIRPIDTIEGKTTYFKCKIKINKNGKKFVEKPFYIDVSNKIAFKYYKHDIAQKINGLIFTNDTICLVVQISNNKYKNTFFWNGKFEQLYNQNIPEKFVPVENININNNLYCGYYYYKNYFVYYYNVQREDVDFYNISIKSIRNNNK